MTAPTAPSVAGGDTSLTATGFAWPNGTTRTHGRTGLTSFTTAPGERASELSALAGELLDHLTIRSPSLNPLQLVALEGLPTSGTKTDAERCYLWWRLVEKLQLHGVPVIAVPPTTVKLYMTGLGNANKREVIAAVKAELPGWEICKTSKAGKPLTTDDDNKADAVVLMAIASHLMGHPLVTVTPYRERALEKLILPPGVRR